MFFLIYKPSGISSFKALKNFKSLIKVKKIGHSGTLDPFASGALLVATDDDTKLFQFISRKDKTYQAIAKFCLTSDTLDIDGKITKIKPCVLPKKEDIIRAFQTIMSQEIQIPPKFSAKKKNGVRAYKLARSGKDFELFPIKMKVFYWKIIKLKRSEVEFKIRVSEGTYIRSLVRDIGDFLGCKAILKTLVRTEIGSNKLRSLVEKIDWSRLFLVKKLIINQTEARLLWNGKIDLVNNLRNISEKTVIVFKNEVIGFIDFSKEKSNFIKLLGNKLIYLLEKANS